ncbi:hypothetical protein, partial [uncultured Subdoligranulum sp.]|uniref:hypothetical protein n=1 Tax=uncultured Subdoligranulum sp. TaxID=512298 RepID=UPI00261FF55E
QVQYSNTPRRSAARFFFLILYCCLYCCRSLFKPQKTNRQNISLVIVCFFFMPACSAYCSTEKRIVSA